MRVGRWVVLLFALIPLGGALGQTAETISNGSYVTLTSDSGQQLSAMPGEGLRLSPNTSGWEQWQYIEDSTYGRFLVSYHGTILCVSANHPKHVPRLRHYDMGLELMNVEPAGSAYSAGSRSGALRNGGRIIIQQTPLTATMAAYSPPAFYYTLHQALESTIVDLRAIPAAATWTIRTIGMQSGRKEPAQSLDNLCSFQLKSTHGTIAGAKWYGGGDENNWAVHQHQKYGEPTFRLVNTEDGLPIHFGQEVLVLMNTSENYGLQSGNRLDDGLEGAYYRQGSFPRYTIEPFPPYVKGNRVPIGVPILIRNSKGAYLSAKKGDEILRWSAGTGPAETWTIVK